MTTPFPPFTDPRRRDRSEPWTPERRALHYAEQGALAAALALADGLDGLNIEPTSSQGVLISAVAEYRRCSELACPASTPQDAHLPSDLSGTPQAEVAS